MKGFQYLNWYNPNGLVKILRIRKITQIAQNYTASEWKPRGV